MAQAETTSPDRDSESLWRTLPGTSRFSGPAPLELKPGGLHTQILDREPSSDYQFGFEDKIHQKTGPTSDVMFPSRVYV